MSSPPSDTDAPASPRLSTPRSDSAATARPILLGTVLAMTALLAGLAGADDTEIYFGRVDPNSDVKPNVMFILDTSGSMTGKDGTGETRLDRMKDAVKALLEQAEGMNAGLMQFNGSYGGGPVLYPITDIDKQICSGSGCEGTTITATPESSEDDAEENLDEDKLMLTGNQLDLMVTSFGEQLIGLRFPGLTIPRGATITGATLELTSASDKDDSDNSIDITAEKIGDAPTFGASAPIATRTWDTEIATWEPGEWESGETYSSSELSAVVQRITDRSDWCGGNAIALKLEKTVDTTQGGLREAMTWDAVTSSGSGEFPTLRVTYDASSLPAGGGCMRRTISTAVAASNDDAEELLSSGAMTRGSGDLDTPRSNSGPQKVGMRFRDIDIPKDSRIRSAYLELDVKERYDDYADDNLVLRIDGEDDDDAKEFKNNDDDITDRDTTSAHVDWDDVPDPPAGTIVTTPDLSPIVQEIVEIGGWEAGNDLVLMMRAASGDGRRSFKTRDKTSSTQPRLTVEFEDEGGGGLLGLTGPTTVTDARDELLDIVDSLVAKDSTPIMDTLVEAMQYFTGSSVIFGQRRGDPYDYTYYWGNSSWAKDNDRRYYRISHPDSYTGGTVVRPDGCDESNLSHHDCKEERIDGSASYVSPIVGECQTNHIVLLSDGAARSSVYAGSLAPFFGLESCEKTDNSEGCGKELAEYLYTNDHAAGVTGRQNIKTHTIAFNLDDPAFLQELATAGGGKMYKASSSSELLGAFRSILEGVNAVDTSFTAPGATVNQFNRLTHRKDIYFAMFRPSDAPRWSGNIKRFNIDDGDNAGGDVLIRDRNKAPAVDPDTGFFASTAYSYWPELDDEGNAVPGPDGHQVTRGGAANRFALGGAGDLGERRTYTWVGDAGAVPSAGVDLSADAQALEEDNALITESVLDIGGVSSDATERADYRSDLLKWARGVDVLDEDGDGSDSDLRRHMGDPMHSRPVILNYSAVAKASGETPGEQSIVFAATNEGYLHAFDVAEDSGEEQFAFMPKELLDKLRPQFENVAGVDHPYGLDGPLSVFRVDTNEDYVVDPGEKAYLFVGMRRGGSNYYALDVSDVHKPRLAWAIAGGPDGTTGFEQLGQSWSKMTPVRMMIDGSERDVLIFGGGYDEAQDDAQVASDDLLGLHPQRGRGLFIVAAETGELLWSGLGASGGTQTFAAMDYPMPGNVRAIDINRDDLVDQIYATDTGGQLWRFDVAQYHQAADGIGSLIKGGVIADLSGSSLAEQRRFYTEPDVALIEEGGERFLTVSVGSGWRAHPLDDDTEDRFYVIRQNAVREAPAHYGKRVTDFVYRPIVDADLAAVAGNLDPAVDADGWYLDFSRTGEKVLGSSVTFDNSVIFSTYIPDMAVQRCSTGVGGGRAYVLDVVSGKPARDLDGDGDVDMDDQSTELKHGGLPPDAMILLTEDGGDEPEILFGGEQIDTGITNVTRRTFWSDLGSEGPITSASADEDDGTELDSDDGDDGSDTTP